MTTGSNELNAKLKACAVREPGRGALTNVLRFQYDLPSNLSKDIINWVYCQHSTSLTSDVFYKDSEDSLRSKTGDVLLTLLCVDKGSALCRLVHVEMVSSNRDRCRKSPTKR